ncbi:hypothetical protein E1B28_010293 [Marasmius oreades]|uniref:Uncharacterized protein n=1 Tax=Marasmius oreades TaxID=181124 RepID=A0A9P7RX08_9AGAR|nr:uncharacterized protein E1B28_010293 [Marasmius oreades]KAG7091242.1 hypothetical protein E1B28_010293 [Marasmius oreades]
MSPTLVKLKHLLALLELLPSYTPHLKLGAIAKIILTTLLVLNIRAFPFVWHFRVFRPVYYVWAELYLIRLKTVFKSPSQKRLAIDKWMEQRSPIGMSPFEFRGTFRSWASIDESDYNFHLSNSSYAKVLDGARFKIAIQLFPQFFRAGGRMALAATHFYFIREIPILAKYEVRMTIGAWDEKWVYVICRFVTNRKRPRKNATPQKTSEGTHSLIHAPIDDTNSGSSSSATPLPSQMSDNSDNIVKALTAKLVTEEPDGSTLHTVSISQMCYKVGRITVPPVMVFASNGMSGPPPPTSELQQQASERYSHTNPPPHWRYVREKSVKQMNELFKGGWKSTPPEERWWEQAMGSIAEEKRLERLEVLGRLRKAMEGMRDMR